MKEAAITVALGAPWLPFAMHAVMLGQPLWALWFASATAFALWFADFHAHFEGYTR